MRGKRDLAQEIKGHLTSEQIKDIIVNDLGLQEDNKKYKCWLHNDGKIPNMSYDHKTSRFHCFSCGATYDIFDHFMLNYGLSFYDACIKIIDTLNLQIEADDKPKVKEIPPKHTKQAEDSVIQYLKRRGFSNDTIKYMPVSSDGKNVVFEYYDLYGQHEANKYREARKFKKDEKKVYFWKCTTDALYNIHNVSPCKPLIITEGEFDAMAVYEAGFQNVVSVKAGAQSGEWIDKNWDFLTSCTDIWLWYDSDRAGLEGVRKIASRLDNVSKVITSDKRKDANEILLLDGKEAVLQCINEARVLEVDNIINVSTIEEFNVHEAEKIRSGIRGIDASIKGFVMGTLNIITGYNGSGKSTLVNQMCIAEPISQGYNTFVFSGELTHSNLKYWLYSTLANETDLIRKETVDKSIYYKVSRYGEEKITEWIKDKLFIYDNDTYTEDKIVATMEKLAKRKGVRVFVLDNLMMIDLQEQRNELTAQKQFIKRLKDFAKKFDAVVHVVAHPRKPQQNGQKLTKFDVAGSGDITNLADYVIGVHRIAEAEKQEYLCKVKEKGEAFAGIAPKDAIVTLFKDRPTGKNEREASLYFSYDRRRFYYNDTDLVFDYGYNRIPRQETFEDMPF